MTLEQSKVALRRTRRRLALSRERIAQCRGGALLRPLGSILSAGRLVTEQVATDQVATEESVEELGQRPAQLQTSRSRAS